MGCAAESRYVGGATGWREGAIRRFSGIGGIRIRWGRMFVDHRLARGALDHRLGPSQAGKVGEHAGDYPMDRAEEALSGERRAGGRGGPVLELLAAAQPGCGPEQALLGEAEAVLLDALGRKSCCG